MKPTAKTPLRALSFVALLATACLAVGCNDDDDDPVAVDTACQRSAGAGSVVVGSGVPGDPALPEPSSGYKLGVKPVGARNYMVVTANPLASQAGCEVLRKGGTAVDAAVAVQMVLGLVEPQSSGIGGGAFLLHYDAAKKEVVAYDGREQAPAAATETYLRQISDTNTAYPLPTAPTVTTSVRTGTPVPPLGV